MHSAAGDDGGLGVVRIKPLGVGTSDAGAEVGTSTDGGVSYKTDPAEISVKDRRFTYPSHIIGPDMDNQALYDAFMPARVDAFLQGVNVNIMAYGQTGSGKTHTMFGPPGIMGRAAAGEYGNELCPDYGLFPRGLLAIFEAVEQMHAAGEAVVLTASAVELSLQGNVDMMSQAAVQQAQKAKESRGVDWSGAQLGVALDRAVEPPRLYGMQELLLDSYDSLREVYAGIATRNTAATKMNDSSSRSHCLASLTLRVRDRAADTIRTSRFQFCDLAGSERLQDAHGPNANPWKDGGECLNGFMTNYSLMMLSSCARQLVEARRKGKMSSFSFRTFLVDLVMLLKESMTGTASTACFVCMSQAPNNLMQSKIALDFGEAFAMLSAAPQAQPAKSRNAIETAARKLLQEAEKVLATPSQGGKYKVMREGQKRDCEQILAILERLGQ